MTTAKPRATQQRGGADGCSEQATRTTTFAADKQGLLDAVAVHGFTTHLAQWTGWQDGADPVDAIREGWDMHVEWGVAHPHVYSIAYGDARSGVSSPAADAISDILRTLVEQAALAGRVAVPVEDAVNMLRAIGSGVVLTLVAMPPETRDLRLSRQGREAALAAILSGAAAPSAPDRSGAAMQLRMSLDDASDLTANERALLGDWLDRLVLPGPGA